MKKRPTGVTVYAILFIIIGFITSLASLQGVILSSLDEEGYREYYLSQISPAMKTRDMPVGLDPDFVAQKMYELNAKIMRQGFYKPFIVFTFCLYVYMIVLGISLLRRRYWAYRTVPAVLLAAAVQMLINLSVNGRVYALLRSMFEETPIMQFVVTFFIAATAIFAVGYCALFLSGVYYFTRPNIRECFE